MEDQGFIIRMLIMIVLILLFGFGIIVIIQDITKEYEDKLQNKWILDYNCDWSNIGIDYTAHYEFSNYSNYIYFVDFAKKIDCKILNQEFRKEQSLKGEVGRKK